MPIPTRQAASLRVAALTGVTMVAFAANSLLCRSALAVEKLDPWSFTSLRILAGAAVLLLLTRVGASAPEVLDVETRSAGVETGRPGPSSAVANERGSLRGAGALLVYAVAFSVAYRTLDAGAGALILFGTVQLSMLAAAWIEGERPTPRVVLGFTMAVSGMVTLLWPAATAPDPMGAALMAVAGVGWGGYSLLGRGLTRPLRATAGNFLRAVPWVMVCWAVALGLGAASTPGTWTPRSVWLALASGGLASGLGYALWYRTLREISTTSAAIAQLSVPGIAMLGGVWLLGEPLSMQATLATLVTLSGIGLATARSTSA